VAPAEFDSVYFGHCVHLSAIVSATQLTDEIGFGVTAPYFYKSILLQVLNQNNSCTD
jgi:hypothetical protein